MIAVPVLGLLGALVMKLAGSGVAAVGPDGVDGSADADAGGASGRSAASKRELEVQLDAEQKKVAGDVRSQQRAEAKRIAREQKAQAKAARAAARQAGKDGSGGAGPPPT